MTRILLYSPDVIGHPRVYCRVIADALAADACEVVVAMGFNDEVGLEDCADLLPLESRSKLEIIATRRFSRTDSPHLTAEELVDLQVAFDVDTTLFIEAEKSNDEFRRIAAGQAPRLRGRSLGIFATTAEWYPGEDSYTGAPRRILASNVRTTLGNVKRAVFNRTQTAKYFYETEIIGRKILDEVLVKDERLAEWYGPPVYWMPEISRPSPAPETAAETQDYDRSRQALQEFLARNAGREPVLYFGDAAYYKGYDLFLEFLASTPATCGIHAGRCSEQIEGARMRSDFGELRARLKQEGRLYERDAYVHTQRLKELYFGAIRLYVTTHRLALSSSTVIQAVEVGKPVLVPDRGLLAHRVKTNRIGDVYSYEDISDLRRQAERLWREELARYEAPARSFWERFSDAAIERFFVRRLLAEGSHQ